MQEVLVLYRKGAEQKWCYYYGGHEEATSELKLLLKEEKDLREVCRIELSTDELCFGYEKDCI